MTDTKHTPGEWYVEKGKTYFFIDSPESPTKSIAQVYEEANANLIAAAPKMLEALKFLECVYRKNFVPEGEVSTTLDFIRSTISEAEAVDE